MTPTERAKRSDALYYETVSVTRRVLCDMIANREADLEDARAENARLRELVEDMLDCIDIQIAFERVPARWMREEFAGRARELRIEVNA